MSQEYAWPAPGREAPERAARPASPPRPLRDLEPALGLAGLGHAFDFCAFGVLAAAVFPQLFFSGLAQPWRLPAALAVWGLAYAVAWTLRPAAAWLDARCGRRWRVGIGRALFTGGCLAVAALPAARHGHASPLLLVLARLGQGLGLAAAARGRLAPQIAASEERRSLLRGWALAAGFAGLAASGVLAGLFLALPRPDLLAWGWRYPFIVALPLGLVGLFGDLQVEDGRDVLRRGRAALRLATICGVRVGA